MCPARYLVIRSGRALWGGLVEHTGRALYVPSTLPGELGVKEGLEGGPGALGEGNRLVPSTLPATCRALCGFVNTNCSNFHFHILFCNYLYLIHIDD